MGSTKDQIRNTIGLVQWKKGQSGNPKGRPRILVSEAIKELNDKGVKPVTKSEVQSVYMRLLNLTMDELSSCVNDKKQSALIRVVGKAMLSGKGFDIIDRILDRGVGKAPQTIHLGMEEEEIPNDVLQARIKSLQKKINGELD